MPEGKKKKSFNAMQVMVICFSPGVQVVNQV